jgi:hypothetical protein
MRRNIRLRMLALIALTMFVASTAATAEGRARCSLAGTAGDWGFNDSGSVLGVGPRIAVGTFTLDATGKVLNGKATVNLNGTISSEAFAGTITVNADCTGSATVDLLDQSGNKLGTITAQVVFVDNMREAREIFTSVVLANGTPLTTVITLEAKRLFVEHSNEE